MNAYLDWARVTEQLDLDELTEWYRVCQELADRASAKTTAASGCTVYTMPNGTKVHLHDGVTAEAVARALDALNNATICIPERIRHRAKEMRGE